MSTQCILTMKATAELLKKIEEELGRESEDNSTGK